MSAREQIQNYGAIAAGGSLGALARAALDVLIPGTSLGFPWATFLANISGSLLLGLLSAYLQVRTAPDTLRLFVTVGVLGSYTTFSAFAVQFCQRAAAAQLGVAVAYVAASLLLGLSAATLGYRLVERRLQLDSGT